MGSCGGSYEFAWLLAYDARGVFAYGDRAISNG